MTSSVRPAQADHPQLALFGAASTAPVKRTTVRASKKVARQSTQAALPLVSKRFLPVAGVPKTRADCPDTTHKHCPHLLCRWNLARLDASDRAGRPGLGAVPRDPRGWTLPVDGDIGEERAGTTVEPRWLELERFCTVWVERDNDGRIVAVNAPREAEWNQFMSALHPSDAVEARNDKGEAVATVTIANDNVALDRDPGEFILTLVRLRGVPSCALDVIDKHGKLGNEGIGDAIGRHRTLVAREARNALIKARDTANDMGIDELDFARALLAMGEE